MTQGTDFVAVFVKNGFFWKCEVGAVKGLSQIASGAGKEYQPGEISRNRAEAKASAKGKIPKKKKVAVG